MRHELASECKGELCSMFVARYQIRFWVEMEKTIDKNMHDNLIIRYEDTSDIITPS